METTLLILNTSTGQLLIDTSTIVRIEASSNYCKLFFTNGKKLVTAKLLKWFEKKLPPDSFIRMHRSHLVNNHFLKPNQSLHTGCELLNGDYVQLSRRRRKIILHQLQAA
jgi:two-component system LytT family response regulator